MPRRRPMPAAVTTIAILHLVFGGLGLFGSCLAGVGLFALLIGPNPNRVRGGPGSPSGPGNATDMQFFLNERLPSYFPFQAGTLVVGLVLSVVLIAAGLGLLNRAAWGRYASIGYAGLSLLTQLVGLVYQVAFVNPTARLFLGEESERFGIPDERQAFLARAQLGLYGMTCFSAVLLLYPILVLGVMLMPSVVASFGAASRDREDGEEEEERPRRRRRDESARDERDRRGRRDDY